MSEEARIRNLAIELRDHLAETLGYQKARTSLAEIEADKWHLSKINQLADALEKAIKVLEEINSKPIPGTRLLDAHKHIDSLRLLAQGFLKGKEINK